MRAAMAGVAILAVAVVAAAGGWLLLRGEGPRAPSNVHVVRSSATGEQWIRWDAGSTDVAGFRGSVRLIRDGEVIAVSNFNTPRAGASQTPVPPFDSRYAGEGCYEAVISVEAVTADARARRADDVSVTVCIDEGRAVRYEPSVVVPEPLVFPAPPPGDVRTEVTRAGEGGYRLTFVHHTTVAWVLTTSRIYTEAGVLVDERDLPAVRGDVTAVDIDATEGLPADGCFWREFVAWTIRDGLLRGWSATRQPVCLSESLATFPLVDDPDVRPPAPATHVEVVGDASGGWRIAWRDNSSDETAFKLLVSVSAEGSNDFVFQQGVATGPDETAVAFPPEVLALPDGCYLTTVYVFAERFETAWGIPGNTARRMCIDGDGVTFELAGG